MLHEYGIYDVSAFAAVLRYDPSGLADYVASSARCAKTAAPTRAKGHTASQTTSMTAHPSLAAKPQTRVYEVMLAQWITSTARAAAGKAQHTATPVRGVVVHRLALQRHLEAGAVILQASATLAQAAARGRAARAKAMGMRIRAEAG